MTMKTTLTLLAAALAAVSHAGLSVTPVSSISGGTLEGFESHRLKYPRFLFGGIVAATYPGQDGFGGIKSAGSRALYQRNGESTDVVPADGTRFLALSGFPDGSGGGTRGELKLTFTGDVYQFGGYFSDGVGGAHATYGLSIEDAYTQFEFYVHDGLGGEVLFDSASVDLISTAGELRWAGFSSDLPLSSVVVRGWETPMDALVISSAPVPEPASMAVLGLGLAALKRRRKG